MPVTEYLVLLNALNQSCIVLCKLDCCLDGLRILIAGSPMELLDCVLPPDVSRLRADVLADGSQ